MNELMRTGAEGEGLYGLLAERARRWAGPENSSLPADTALALLAGLRYTLDTAGYTPGEDASAALRRGEARLLQKLSRARRLWQSACLSEPGPTSQSYRDTLRSVGTFFARWDRRYFPQEIPCDIDYQLCKPVEETVPGVSYIEAYLERVLAENRILGGFDGLLADGVLRACCPDYKTLPVNLCEPVFTNALGLALLGKDPRALVVTDADRAALLAGKISWEKALPRAAEAVTDALGISDDYTRAYAAGIACDLLPRLRAAAKAGELAGVFVPIAKPDAPGV